MQHLVIFEAEPRGLPLGERLLPEYLRHQGYRTHAVGKWHLGFYRREYTPTFRGFDSHYGYYQGFQDYYDHSVRATVSDIIRVGNRRKTALPWTRTQQTWNLRNEIGKQRLSVTKKLTSSTSVKLPL